MNMLFQILFSLFVSSLAAPTLQGYNLPTPNGGGGLISGSDNGFRNVNSGSANSGNLGITTAGGSASSCANGQVSGADGSCVEAEVNRKIFVFQAPEQTSSRQITPTATPKPKLNYNIVFVRTPEGPEGYEPVVIPPAQQKTLVYVLNEEGEDTGPQVIEMPDIQPHAPEVFYINYKEGDNPQLPIGVDLQTALASAMTEQGQLLFGGGGAAGSSSFGGDIGTSSGGFGGAASGGFGGVISGGNTNVATGGFGGSVSGGSTNVGAGGNGGFVSGFGGSVSGGSISGGAAGSGGIVSGNIGFAGAVSGGITSVTNGGNGGFISDRGIQRGYTPPNPPPNVYGTPFVAN